MLVHASIGLALALSAATATAGPQPAAAGDAQRVRRYTTRGTVEALDRDRQRVDIAHEAIPGFMGAMTMTFAAASSAQIDGLAIGDRVRFTFSVEDDARLVLRAIVKEPRV